ncbi:MAG: alpha/beta hydrolase [Crocinitomicaceae bacterium]|nr:alpha/beta hydrolase [Crocinitomicaceae bacterium]
MKNEKNVGGLSTLNNKDQSTNARGAVSRSNNNGGWIKRHKESIRRYKSLTMSVVAAGLIMVTSTSCDKIENFDELVPQTVEFDGSLSSIDVNGTKLHAETFGNPGDPIIVGIHGGPGADYKSILNLKDFASEGYFVVLYDQRGSGLSQRHDADAFTVQVMIDDLKGVINHYQMPGSKIILAGHSWGAMLATAYINQYPNEVDGMILMEPGGLTWEDTKDYLSKVLAINIFSEATSDMLYQDQFLTVSDHAELDYKSAVGGANAHLGDNVTGLIGPTPFRRFGSVCNGALKNHADEVPFDFTTNLSQVNIPVLFVYSELNKAYGFEHAQKVSAPFLDVQLFQVIGAGHEMVLSGWNNLRPTVLTYLNSIN